MTKFRHSKLRNAGLLFEFLLRQVTVDVLNKKKDSPAIKIIKKQFNEHTEIGKELALYNLITTKKFKSDKKADFFLSEVLRQREKLNNSVLRREKYNIIKSIKEHYDVNKLFSSSVPDYKVYASTYKLFEGIGELSDPQKQVLKEYISSISNTNNFSLFVENQIPVLKTKLNKKVSKIKDKVLKIKLQEAVNCVDKFCLNESRKTDDNSVVQLLRYYELDKELNKI